MKIKFLSDRWSVAGSCSPLSQTGEPFQNVLSEETNPQPWLAQAGMALRELCWRVPCTGYKHVLEAYRNMFSKWQLGV